MRLSTREITGLYLFLKSADSQDPVLIELQRKLASELYDSLTIEELESLEDFYSKNIDVLKGRV